MPMLHAGPRAARRARHGEKIRTVVDAQTATKTVVRARERRGRRGRLEAGSGPLRKALSRESRQVTTVSGRAPIVSTSSATTYATSWLRTTSALSK